MSVERAKQLVDALSKIEKWRGKPASLRKRRFTRFGVRGTGLLVNAVAAASASEHTSLSIQLRDISRGGVGFLHSEPLRVDYSYRLLLTDQGLVLASLPLFVRYCQQIEKSAYLIGGEFGIEASMLAAIGVPVRDIASNDVPEDSLNTDAGGDFIDPDQVEAA